MNELTNDDLEKLATDEQKQLACSVAVDAYDKTTTYYDELRRFLKKEHFEIYE